MYLENIKVRVSTEKEREFKEFLMDISGHILEHKGLYRLTSSGIPLSLQIS